MLQMQESMTIFE